MSSSHEDQVGKNVPLESRATHREIAADEADHRRRGFVSAGHINIGVNNLAGRYKNLRTGPRINEIKERCLTENGGVTFEYPSGKSVTLFNEADILNAVAQALIDEGIITEEYAEKQGYPFSSPDPDGDSFRKES